MYPNLAPKMIPIDVTDLISSARSDWYHIRLKIKKYKYTKSIGQLNF